MASIIIITAVVTLAGKNGMIFPVRGSILLHFQKARMNPLIMLIDRWGSSWCNTFIDAHLSHLICKKFTCV